MTSFSFIHISDHHLPAAETTLVRGFSPVYAFRAVMKHIAENVAARADFIVSTGDLVDPGSRDAYQFVCQMLNLRLVSDLPGPQLVSIEGLQDHAMYFLPGNHDDREFFFNHLYRSIPHTGLMNITFQHKGVQFICLDWGMQAKAVASPELFAFIRQALEAELPSVILTHHHVIPIGVHWLDKFLADDIDQFWAAVADPGVSYKVLGVISGHVHITYEEQVSGIPVLGVRSTAFPFSRTDEPLITLQPPHYRHVTIQDGILTSQIYEVPL